MRDVVAHICMRETLCEHTAPPVRGGGRGEDGAVVVVVVVRAAGVMHGSIKGCCTVRSGAHWQCIVRCDANERRNGKEEC